MGQVIGKRGSRNRSYSFSEKDKKGETAEPVMSGTATLPANAKKEKKKRSVSSAAKFSSIFSNKKVSVNPKAHSLTHSLTQAEYALTHSTRTHYGPFPKLPSVSVFNILQIELLFMFTAIRVCAKHWKVLPKIAEAPFLSALQIQLAQLTALLASHENGLSFR